MTNTATELADEAATSMPTELAEFSEALVEMLQRFYDGHVDDFDDIGMMRRVQAATTLVTKFSGFFATKCPILTRAMIHATKEIYGTVPSIEHLVILRDLRRRDRAAAQQAAAM
jgi:hypothetical protein